VVFFASGSDSAWSFFRKINHICQFAALGYNATLTPDSAARLQRWHDSGCRGARPPGRLDGKLRPFTRAWATVLYHLVYDPDGRPLKNRMRRSF